MKEFDDVLSLHVRRTDYLTNSENHFNLTLDYYEGTNSFDDLQVIVFSDDPDWCREQDLFSNDRFLVSESEIINCYVLDVNVRITLLLTLHFLGGEHG